MVQWECLWSVSVLLQAVPPALSSWFVVHLAKGCGSLLFGLPLDLNVDIKKELFLRIAVNSKHVNVMIYLKKLEQTCK